MYECRNPIIISREILIKSGIGFGTYFEMGIYHTKIFVVIYLLLSKFVHHPNLSWETRLNQ